MTIAYTTYYGFVGTKNESPSAIDWSATYWNWFSLDTILYGALQHTHDGAAALSAPTGVLSLVSATTGGTLLAGKTYYFVISYLDVSGRETAKSSVVSITTDAAISTPATPTYVEATDLVAAASALTGGSYWYKISYVKGGGETPCSEPVYVEVPTDQTYSAQIHFTSLTAAANGADKIFIYRKIGLTGSWNKLIEISAVDRDYYVDDNTAVVNCDVGPKTVNTTNSYNKITIDFSGMNYTEATYVKIYVTTSVDSSATPVATWLSTSHLITSVDVTIATPVTSYVYTGAALSSGKPKNVSECASNPSKIALATQVTGYLPWANLPSDFCWKLPVANEAALPATGVDGEARIVKDVGRIQWWNDTLATPTWDEIEGGIEVVQLNEFFNIQTDFDTKVLPYLPSNPTDGQLVAVRNSNLTWGIFPRAVYLYMWRNDWDTPAWQLVNQVLPLADSEGNYTNYSAPVGTMWVYNNGGTCTLRVMQPSGSASSIPSTYAGRCSELAYWGFFDTPEDLTYVNDVSSYMSTGEVAFVLDTHSFYYYDDTLATPAWVKGPGVIKTEETIADVTLSATPTDIELKINDILEKLRTAGVIEAE
jgi:hypothetical protein